MVTEKDFENSDGILSAVNNYDQPWVDKMNGLIQPMNFIVIQCTIELQRSLGKLYCNLYRFIETLKERIVTKCNDAVQRKETIETVLFYSSTSNMNDQWKQIINSIRLCDKDKEVPKVFYIDLTKVPEYTKSKEPRYDIENHIIDETLKNLIINKDKEVFVSDWPMPYEYSERKREYEYETSERKCQRKLESQEIEMLDNDNDTDDAKEDADQSFTVHKKKQKTKKKTKNKYKEVFVSDWPMPYYFSENVRVNKRVKRLKYLILKKWKVMKLIMLKRMLVRAMSRRVRR